ncbi:MAG TPA: sulfotransferase [Luteimonas sp.]|nr:sulfotransferase [Luteimonas sp.]
MSSRARPARTDGPKGNFFLVGAPKAGTTSVERLLRELPDVFLSPIKEPCHFCPDVAEQLAPSFRRKQQVDVASYLASAERPPVGLAWVASPDDYARLYEGADGHKVVGECSTFYLSSKVAARRIRDYNPDAKIVAVLRRPLDRIRSHYEMDRVHGTTRESLPELVERELALGEDANWGNSHYYVGASRYESQLREFRRHFPAANLCVLSFEQILADPARELSRLFAFLGIDPPEGAARLPSANRGRAARFPAFNSALHESGYKSIVSGALKRVLPRRLERAAKEAYYRRGARMVPDRDLARVQALLREAGVEESMAIAG